jgi:hypothetical protein
VLFNVLLSGVVRRARRWRIGNLGGIILKIIPSNVKVENNRILCVQGLKRLRHDLESILTESNKRTKLLAIELTKIYDMVEDPPEIESMDDEVLLLAWKDKTLAEINELDELDKGIKVRSCPYATMPTHRLTRT